MKTEIIRLKNIVEVVPAKISAIDESTFSTKPSQSKWSKKEILGHLCDSAFNNIQRFVRIQYENELKIVYDQDKWVQLNDYQNLKTKDLLMLWTALNIQIIHIWKKIPKDAMFKEMNTGKNKVETVSLEFLIKDYNDHLVYHLNQIIDLKI